MTENTPQPDLPALQRKEARRPATEAEARALASATRLRILRVTLDQSLTNKEIAERLGRNPASTLHHVRRLVDTGFLAPDEERRGKRGAREVPYRATGKSWTLDVQEHANARGEENHAGLQAFLEEISGVDMNRPDVAFSRLGLRLTESERKEFVDKVCDLLDDYARSPHTPEHGTPYGVFFVVHPDPR